MTKATPHSKELVLTVSTQGLMDMLSCGRPTAIRIGEAAGAKLIIGERKILWNVNAVRKYLDSQAE